MSLQAALTMARQRASAAEAQAERYRMALEFVRAVSHGPVALRQEGDITRIIDDVLEA